MSDPIGEPEPVDARRIAELMVAHAPCMVVVGADLAAESGLAMAQSAAAARATAEPFHASTAWSVYGPRMRMIEAAIPGIGHHAIRRLQAVGVVGTVATTSDDGLLREAGVADVIALQGDPSESSCPACGYSEPLGCLIALLPLPVCAACGSVLRPGPMESGHADAVARAVESARSSRLLAIVGSALDDADGASLADVALASGGILIGIGASTGDALRPLAMTLLGKVGVALASVADRIDADLADRRPPGRP